MKANWEDSVRRDHVKSKLKVSSAMCQGKRLEKERKTLKFREQRSFSIQVRRLVYVRSRFFSQICIAQFFAFRVALRSFLKVPLKRRVVGGRQGVGGEGGGAG